MFCSIDPGKTTGIALFDQFGAFKASYTLEDNGAADYINKLLAFKLRYEVRFALIEMYVNFGKYRPNAFKVQEEVRFCKEVFPLHILVKTCQWNPKAYKDRMKRQMAAQYLNCVFANSHCTDAALMGKNIFDLIKVYYNGMAYSFLSDLSEGIKQFPTRQELAEMVREKQLEKAT